jgi:hypothetical protein
MAKVEVHLVPQGSEYLLELYHEGVHIGEYERSRVSEESGDREAKVKEAEGASDLLLEVYRRHGGKITVRWSGKKGVAYRLRKEIRAYLEGQPDPGLGAEVLDTIPKRYWRKP